MGLTPVGGAPRSRFWWGFSAGWAAYFGVTMSFGVVAESDTLLWSAAVAAVNTLPPALMSWVVALNRHRLLRPEWSVWRTLRVHAVVGVLFGLATGALLIGLSIVTGVGTAELPDASPWTQFFAVTVSAIFLYVIFVGFLLWSESIRRVQESHRLAAREAVLRAEAEAKAVRAQFNPHFVFNTLHSLMLLVRADPAAAERAIEDVATLIRYASIVQRQDIDAVPLAKEVEVSRRYAALEKLRLQDRLAIEWSLEVDPAELTIPAFALQTLVENAIKHGIEPSTEGGRVRVRVRRSGEEATITVSDDGVGADPASVDANPGHGLGLLRQRLEARYGPDASLEWTTTPGSGFEATLRIPVERPIPSPALDVIEARETLAPPAFVG